RVNAKPGLVVARALNPSAARTRAEPASHGFGMTKAFPLWSARNSAAFFSCRFMQPSLLAPRLVPLRRRGRDGGNSHVALRRLARGKVQQPLALLRDGLAVGGGQTSQGLDCQRGSIALSLDEPGALN